MSQIDSSSIFYEKLKYTNKEHGTNLYIIKPYFTIMDYVNLDQTIQILPDFAIVFSFYDHNTLGENMMHIYLEQISTKEIVTLRLDTTDEKGLRIDIPLSCFLHDEMDKILEKALGNESNTQLYHINSKSAICCCLNMIYPLTKDLLEKYNVQLHHINWRFTNLNEYFPQFIPSNERLSYKNLQKDPQFGYYIIMDENLSKTNISRGNSSKWGNSKKKLFGQFIKELCA